MASNSKSPKAPHRFGPSGRPTMEKKDRITTDDIFASLTRQAELKQKLGKEDQLTLEEIAETEDLSRFQGFNPEPDSPFIMAGRKSYGHLVFVFMLLTGLTVVWLYSSISKPFDLSSLDGVLQKSGVQSIFANMSQLGGNRLSRFGWCSLESTKETRHKSIAPFSLRRRSPSS